MCLVSGIMVDSETTSLRLPEAEADLPKMAPSDLSGSHQFFSFFFKFRVGRARQGVSSMTRSVSPASLIVSSESSSMLSSFYRILTSFKRHSNASSLDTDTLHLCRSPLACPAMPTSQYLVPKTKFSTLQCVLLSPQAQT
jgi:hypothetical protein